MRFPLLLITAVALIPTFIPTPAFPQGIITTIAGTDFVFPLDGLPALEAPIGGLTAVATDELGNVFLTETIGLTIKKLSVDGIVTVVAGNGLEGFSGDGGPATGARLNFPLGLSTDGAGNLFIVDQVSHRIRKVSPDGIITTVAGNGQRGFSGDGGPATSASLNGPRRLAVDAVGNLYISDRNNHRIRKVSPGGIISTVAGDGQRAFSGDGGPATSASLNGPRGLAVDAAGNLYIADGNNHRIRKVSPGGIITTVAGDGQPIFSGDGGPATSASLNSPVGIAFDAADNLYIADRDNLRIRKVASGGIITTVAGNGESGFSGDGGQATLARLLDPRDVALDAAGNLFIADATNRRLRKVAPNGIISTAAGTGSFRALGDGGPAAIAELNFPTRMALDASGNLYVTEVDSHRIRKISPEGIISTVAGDGTPGFFGDGRLATSASLFFPRDVAVDGTGNIYIADRANNRIRRVSVAGLITTVAGNGDQGFSGDGGPATDAVLNLPFGVAVDGVGNLYIADSTNRRVRKVSPEGLISTIAGNGERGVAGDGGPAIEASLVFPVDLALDDGGNLYIADFANNRIRKVSPDGMITTVAGNGEAGFSGDEGPATSAALSGPIGLAFDGAGNLYFADRSNHRIRKVTLEGTISTVAGNGVLGYLGDGGPATSASLSTPRGTEADAAGNVYIADSGNQRIRKVLTERPLFLDVPARLTLSADAGGPPSAAGSVFLGSSIPGVGFSIELSTSSGEPWLTATPSAGSMPTAVEVRGDPGGLEPGTYEGTVTVMAPDALPPARQIAVTFMVQQAAPARLAVEPDNLTFSLTEGVPAVVETILVANQGGGSLDFNVSATTTSGGTWLSVSPLSGTATAIAPVPLTVEAGPGGLVAGTYRGEILIVSTTTDELITVLVTMTVTEAQQTVLLSKTGLTFTAVAGGGKVPSQSFEVLNIGKGVMSWAISASTLSGGTNWLQVNPENGSTDAAAPQVPSVRVDIDQGSLTAGVYYGEIQVTAPTADNSPQTITVVLQVLPEGTNPGPLVQPTALIFTGEAGGTSSGSQDLLVYNRSAGSTSFASSRLTFDGTDWFVQVPTNAPVTPDRASRIIVEADPTDLTPGIRRGVLTLLFADGRVRLVTILLVLVGDADPLTVPLQVAQAGCVPAELLPVFTSLQTAFSVPAAWPNAIEVRVVDDGGNAMRDGSVIATFSNGDPGLGLVSLKDGRWSGTWQVQRKDISDVTVSVTAEKPELGIEGTSSLTGTLSSVAEPPPKLTHEGVVSAASFESQVPLAPGSIISVFGEALSEGVGEALTLPLGTELAGTSITLAGRPLPMLFASERQINAMVPYGIAINTRHHLLVRRGTTISQPIPLSVAAAQPAIFLTRPGMSTQGHVYRFVDDATQILAAPGDPVGADDVLIIYASGLGAVDPPVDAGLEAPGQEPFARTVNRVKVTIGDVRAKVFFSGLAPGFTGLYQVNAFVPEGVASGEAVPVVLEVANQVSQPVTIAVR